MNTPVHRLTPAFGVAGQLDADDIAALAAQGWRSLLCKPCRPLPTLPP